MADPSPSRPRRGAAVVEAIFEATFEELARVGYAALAVEDVAARAGVSRATVYRRWPAKVDLVNEAFASARDRVARPVADTGTLEGDLLALVRSMVQLGRTALGRATLRLALFDHRLPETAPIVATIARQHEAFSPEILIHRAVERGELPPRLDSRLIVDTVRGAVLLRSLLEAPLDEAYAPALVALVLDGLRGARPVDERRAGDAPARTTAGAGEKRASRSTASGRATSGRAKVGGPTASTAQASGQAAAGRARSARGRGGRP